MPDGERCRRAQEIREVVRTVIITANLDPLAYSMFVFGTGKWAIRVAEATFDPEDASARMSGTPTGDGRARSKQQPTSTCRGKPRWAKQLHRNRHRWS